MAWFHGFVAAILLVNSVCVLLQCRRIANLIKEDGRLRRVLVEFSAQILPDEGIEHPKYADYEGAYTTMVTLARNALELN